MSKLEFHNFNKQKITKHINNNTKEKKTTKTISKYIEKKKKY